MAFFFVADKLSWNLQLTCIGRFGLYSLISMSTQTSHVKEIYFFEEPLLGYVSVYRYVGSKGKSEPHSSPRYLRTYLAAIAWSSNPYRGC
jgi:hypothetical protein